MKEPKIQPCIIDAVGEWIFEATAKDCEDLVTGLINSLNRSKGRLSEEDLKFLIYLVVKQAEIREARQPENVFLA